ncbi:MAG: insulinase family protein [Campylobacterales bacterium]|nr:insulinase family protein [Campylobacterales bacterium]
MKAVLLVLMTVGVLMSKSLPKHYTQTLENGLEVVAIPLENDTDVISIDVFYKVGSRNEVMGKSGLAHMLEHMNFKSTKELKAGEFDKIVKGFGGVNNASTGFDYTHYYIKSSSGNLDKSLNLFSGMMLDLKLTDSEFQPERDVVMEERKWRTDNNPMGLLYFKLFNTIYDSHSYHWTPIGFIDDIKNWKIEDLEEFYQTYYQPKNAILLVSGDIDKDEIFKLAKKRFGKLKNRKEIPSRVVIEPEQMGPKRTYIEYESQVEMLAIAWRIPNFESKDTTYLNAVGEILSSGKSSRLQKLLVDKKKLVNSVYAYAMDLKDPGVFMVMAVCNPGVKAETVEKEVLKELKKLGDKGVSKAELDKLKVNTKADFIYSLEASSNVSNIFGSYLVRGNLDPLLEYEEIIENLENDDIKKSTKKYLVEKSSTTVILRKDDETK